MKIGVIGTGSWGTALVKILTENGHFVKWYIHEAHVLDYIKIHHSNPNYFPGIILPIEFLSLHDEVQNIFEDTEVILLACPSAYLPFNLQKISQMHFENKFIISAIKGFVGEESLFVSEYLEKFYNVQNQRFAVLSGPSHAEEVVQKKITFIQLGSIEQNLVYKQIFENEYFKVRFTSDYLGLQLAGILKNVYAIALGIVNGLNYGDNLQAALTTAASKEMKQIFQSLNYPVNDLLQYGYLGDLLVTAYSMHSRNRNLGIGIGQGKSVNEVCKLLKTIPEGYFTLQKLPQKINIQEFPILKFTQSCMDNPKNSNKFLKELLNDL